MSLDQFFVFDETYFVNGQGRLLFSELGTDSDVAVPAGPVDIFAQVSPYAPATGWVDLGATNAPPVYDRDVALTEWKIQQILTPVLEIPQAITRTIKMPAAEFARPDLLQMFENADAPTAVAAATGASAYAAAPFGQFTDLNQYRVALACFQPLEAGAVVEGTDGPVRPRLVVQVFYRCSLTAESVSVTYEQAGMVAADITLKCYPEPDQPQNQEHGTYFFEDAGTITTS
jgi:hypothetical protein